MPNRQDEFERVAMPHSRSLLRVARRLVQDRAVAEDLVQESLLRAWRSFNQFHPGTNARAWLFRILLNAYYARGRKLRAAPMSVEIDADERAFEQSFVTAAEQRRSLEISRALDALSAEYRAVLVLVVVEGFTCQEASEILNVPIGTVMSRVSRARQALRDRLAPPGPSMEAPRTAAAYAAKHA